MIETHRQHVKPLGVSSGIITTITITDTQRVDALFMVLFTVNSRVAARIREYPHCCHKKKVKTIELKESQVAMNPCSSSAFISIYHNASCPHYFLSTFLRQIRLFDVKLTKTTKT